MNEETGSSANRIRLDDPLTDGRQSETALKVWRGAARLLRLMDYACLPEVTLASGRRADLLALGPKQELWIIEVKSSLADFRADTKWPDYRQHCDRLFFATHPDVPLDIFPEEAGLILSDGFGAEIIREAPEHKVAAATRKAVTLRFARNAAQRLHDLSDPDGRRFYRGL
ncbi:MmcB family DNA repair protein [uncultured Roseibium sp.]|uniref:MmcB family DNA repair protein n=1 Tax=uncultured Roseibium sp. TaxID=1936171 RepID=UPI00321707B9